MKEDLAVVELKIKTIHILKTQPLDHRWDTVDKNITCMIHEQIL